MSPGTRCPCVMHVKRRPSPIAMGCPVLALSSAKPTLFHHPTPTSSLVLPAGTRRLCDSAATPTPFVALSIDWTCRRRCESPRSSATPHLPGFSTLTCLTRVGVAGRPAVGAQSPQVHQQRPAAWVVWHPQPALSLRPGLERALHQGRMPRCRRWSWSLRAVVDRLDGFGRVPRTQGPHKASSPRQRKGVRGSNVPVLVAPGSAPQPQNPPTRGQSFPCVSSELPTARLAGLFLGTQGCNLFFVQTPLAQCPLRPQRIATASFRALSHRM